MNLEDRADLLRLLLDDGALVASQDRVGRETRRFLLEDLDLLPGEQRLFRVIAEPVERVQSVG
ncbi:hypothetical protein QFZ49_007083 [Streptomyces turgidiscabies]|uniref:Uncharacterized protein n=1 Tax=Streptomyces turgidiscabies TaxID=85558 RepID=A0ABU0RZE6_9ACTN|nr:hypothetical protein [Streptomyces turgidiscabies]